MPEAVRRRVVRRRQPRTAAAPAPASSGRVPRVARLMAFAIVADEMIRRGEVRDYAELARIGSVSRARVTQIMNPLNLAPATQEQLLSLSPTTGPDPVTERQVRPLLRTADWTRQQTMFAAL